jgi:hypothetical protein
MILIFFLLFFIANSIAMQTDEDIEHKKIICFLDHFKKEALKTYIAFDKKAFKERIKLCTQDDKDTLWWFIQIDSGDKEFQELIEEVGGNYKNDSAWQSALQLLYDYKTEKIFFNKTQLTKFKSLSNLRSPSPPPSPFFNSRNIKEN